jgi:hypothetical protein
MLALLESEVALYQIMDVVGCYPMGQAGSPIPPRLMPADDILILRIVSPMLNRLIPSLKRDL